MGKLVLLTNLLDLNKPGVGVVRASSKEVFCKMMKDIILKSGDHSKQAELSKVENGWEWERARNEEDKWFWGFLVELQQTFKCTLVVVSKSINFRL